MAAAVGKWLLVGLVVVLAILVKLSFSFFVEGIWSRNQTVF
jgi:hypothetical protein